MSRRHGHRWIPVAIDKVESGFRNEPDSTIVLRRCECGGYDTLRLDGSWTEDNVGINEETIRDLLLIANLTSVGHE
jgi:hypothetical protein